MKCNSFNLFLTLAKPSDDCVLTLKSCCGFTDFFEFIACDGISKTEIMLDIDEIRDMVTHLNNAIKLAEEAVREKVNEK